MLVTVDFLKDRASVLPRKSQQEILKVALGRLFPERTEQEGDAIIRRVWAKTYLPM